ncbi:MAG: type I-E CRISPR-associated protein Cas6/Cse3/CasE [Thermaerobacter sp.]|nr:type I-E CRISPR-associated protein Cas6/Cse3/CasE [Thermaerobacter sp.]
MYLSRLTLNARSAMVRKDLTDCRRMHRTIMSAFPVCEGDARAAYRILHRIETLPRSNTLTMLVQSEMEPRWADLPKNYLAMGHEPEVKGIDQSLAGIRRGMVLNFRLRANPTKKVDTKSGPDAKRRNGRRKKLQGEQEQVGWLLRKASSGGFAVLDVRRTEEAGEVGSTSRIADSTEPYEQVQMFFGSVLFDGTLQVTDAERFRKTLADGLGSGKAFGFGLLSVALRAMR